LNVEIDFTVVSSHELELLVEEIFNICTGPEKSPGWDEENQFNDLNKNAVFLQCLGMVSNAAYGMKFNLLKYGNAEFSTCFFQVRRFENQYLLLIDFDCEDNFPGINLAIIDVWRRKIASQIGIASTIELDF
jgi:hypothetical protein